MSICGREIRNANGRLLASLAAVGQQTPVVVVAIPDKPDRYQLIDGYKRAAALEQLGRDTVDAVLWEMTEADALILDRAMRFSEPESALEQGWLLQELEHRFGYSLDDLARRFDRSVSWVSRRLALVEQLPESVQQRVRLGQIPAQVAMKYLAPVARAKPDDCQRMAETFAKHRCSSRQAGELYSAWRDASATVRQQILDSPELFLKAHQQVSPQSSSAADELLRDLTMVMSIVNRAGRRLARAATLMGYTDFESARHKIECTVRDLTYLAERIEKEQDHVKPKSTQRDSGTPRSGRGEAGDCASSEAVASECAQSPALAVIRSAGAGPSGESRTLPKADPGVVGHSQGQSCPGP